MIENQNDKTEMGKRQKIYFLSDAHLGSLIFEDKHAHERILVRFFDTIKQDAKAIYLLGDMFDFWFEYKMVAPKGYVRFLGKLAELADNGVELHYFIGNHDLWMFGYLEQEIGMTLHKKTEMITLCGKRFFMAHGDEMYVTDKKFKILRSIFHSTACQKMFACLPSTWGLKFGYAWSASNRKKHLSNSNKYEGENNELLVQFAKQHEKEEHFDYYIFGHRHIMLDFYLATKSRVVILGDFMYLFSYAELDENGNLELKQFEV